MENQPLEWAWVWRRDCSARWFTLQNLTCFLIPWCLKATSSRYSGVTQRALLRPPNLFPSGGQEGLSQELEWSESWGKERSVGLEYKATPT